VPVESDGSQQVIDFLQRGRRFVGIGIAQMRQQLLKFGKNGF
jgi:hypothetical protein